MTELWELENEIYAEGFELICGVDEAGRGPLAGPVCAAAVILPEGCVIDVLNNLTANDIYLKITDTTRPGVFVPMENKENEDWLALVMPMMVPR